jgi:hypothetical protein
MLNVVMLNVVMPSVVMLSVVAPSQTHTTVTLTSKQVTSMLWEGDFKGGHPTPFGIMTLSTTTFSITINEMQHSALCHLA